MIKSIASVNKGISRVLTGYKYPYRQCLEGLAKRHNRQETIYSLNVLLSFSIKI
jgi:hypothetical protein